MPAPDSLRAQETLGVFARAAAAARDPQAPDHPFPSPADWRDLPIYFVLLDRFNNPAGQPRSTWDRPFAGFQVGTFAGGAAQLDYIKGMGFGAIWVSPIPTNLPWDDGSYSDSIPGPIARFRCQRKLEERSPPSGGNRPTE